IAAFLMGKTTTLPSQPLSCSVSRDQLLLYLGRLQQVGQSGAMGEFFQEIGWEGDRARCQMILAEVARRQEDAGLSRKHLEASGKWILHSGSVEHLCQLHLVRARLDRFEGNWDTAQRALDEGLRLARQFGLRLV